VADPLCLLPSDVARRTAAGWGTTESENGGSAAAREDQRRERREHGRCPSSVTDGSTGPSPSRRRRLELDAHGDVGDDTEVRGHNGSQPG
jgi:hypothetical protein